MHANLAVNPRYRPLPKILGGPLEGDQQTALYLRATEAAHGEEAGLVHI